MGISRKRRLETLETQLPTSEDSVSQEAVCRAIRRLKQESPHAIWLVENLILKHARWHNGVAIPHTGIDNLEPTEEELVAYRRLNELTEEEAHLES